MAASATRGVRRQCGTDAMDWRRERRQLLQFGEWRPKGRRRLLCWLSPLVEGIDERVSGFARLSILMGGSKGGEPVWLAG